MIEIICKMINKPMAMGMPKSIRYKTDITQAINLINCQQNTLTSKAERSERSEV
jgi:hypothetical protein